MAQRNDTRNDTNIMTTITSDDHKVLTALAKQEGLSLRKYLRKLIHEHVQKHDYKEVAEDFYVGDPRWEALNDISISTFSTPMTDASRILSRYGYRGTQANLLMWNLTQGMADYFLDRIDPHEAKTLSEDAAFNMVVNDQIYGTSTEDKAKALAGDVEKPDWPTYLRLVADDGKEVDPSVFDFELTVLASGDKQDLDNLRQQLSVIRQYYGVNSVAKGMVSFNTSVYYKKIDPELKEQLPEHAILINLGSDKNIKVIRDMAGQIICFGLDQAASESDEDVDQLKFVDIYGHDVDPELFDHWATVIADKDKIDSVDDFLATVRKYYHSKPLDITDIHNRLTISLDDVKDDLADFSEEDNSKQPVINLNDVNNKEVYLMMQVKLGE